MDGCRRTPRRGCGPRTERRRVDKLPRGRQNRAAAKEPGADKKARAAKEPGRRGREIACEPRPTAGRTSHARHRDAGDRPPKGLRPPHWRNNAAGRLRAVNRPCVPAGELCSFPAPARSRGLEVEGVRMSALSDSAWSVELSRRVAQFMAASFTGGTRI